MKKPLKQPLPTPVDTLIVDDHALVRTGLRRLIEDHPKTGAIAEAADAETALQLVRQQQFALVLMDLSLPGLSGLEGSVKLLGIDPDARIIIVTGVSEPQHVERLMAAGVQGYLSKGCSADEMHTAIDHVIAGRAYIEARVAQDLSLRSAAPADDNPFSLLTRREMEIVLQLLDGKRNRQIGDVLFISEKTVSSHRRSAFDKLAINTSAELARLAMKHGVWVD